MEKARSSSSLRFTRISRKSSKMGDFGLSSSQDLGICQLPKSSRLLKNLGTFIANRNVAQIIETLRKCPVKHLQSHQGTAISKCSTNAKCPVKHKPLQKGSFSFHSSQNIYTCHFKTSALLIVSFIEAVAIKIGLSSQRWCSEQHRNKRSWKSLRKCPGQNGHDDSKSPP